MSIMPVCLFAAKYTMTAQVYNQTTVQGVDGSIDRTWNYSSPSLNISCDARIITTAGSRINFVETWGAQYTNSQFISVACSIQLSNRQRIGQVMAKNTWLSHKETVYDVLGVYPVIDPFGNVIEYTALAAEVMDP